MTNQQAVKQTADYVRTKFAAESTGHDWWHMYRVWQLSKQIAAKEPQADLFTVELAALLHDIADWKFHDGDEEAGPKAAREWLESISMPESVISHIEGIIRTISFKGAGVASNMKTLEGQIVHDADKLDALGAVGIARCFAYGGSRNNPMHDPELKPTMHASFTAYKNAKSTSVNHFYEKLLLLKERLYTKTARQLAEQRHDYMDKFLNEFLSEWDGKK